MTFFHLGKKLADLSHSEKISDLFMYLPEQHQAFSKEILEQFNARIAQLGNQLDNCELNLDHQLDMEFGFPEASQYFDLPEVTIEFPIFVTRRFAEHKSIMEALNGRVFYNTDMGKFYWNAMLGLNTPEMRKSLTRKLHDVLGPMESPIRLLNSISEP